MINVEEEIGSTHQQELAKSADNLGFYMLAARIRIGELDPTSRLELVMLAEACGEYLPVPNEFTTERLRRSQSDAYKLARLLLADARNPTERST